MTVNAVYENHDLVFAGSSDTVLDQSGQALAGSGMTIAAGGSILNQSGATLRVNGALDNSGTISGGTLALDAGGQFTNRKNVNVDKLTGSNLTFTQGEAGASFETTKNEVTNSQFVWTQGSISLDALGKGNRYELGGHVGDSVTVDLDLLTSDSTVNIGQGAELAVGTISLDGTESTVTLAGGTLKTSLDQGTFTADKKMKVATIPVGYGDGYARGLSNRGEVLIRGKRARILGRVCMDQFMVDVTDIPDTVFMDEVVLIGRDGDDEITVEELSEICGRFNYEFVCCLGKRIPRVYKGSNLLEK